MPGLAPTLSFASLNVRPVLLSLFEKYLVNLDATYLRSASKSMILALLPGLEEKNSEEYGRTLIILYVLKKNLSNTSETNLKSTDTSGGQLFWQSLLLASLSSPSKRQGVLAYLEETLPVCDLPFVDDKTRTAISEDQRNRRAVMDEVISPEPGLLIRCFATGLMDDQILIQRGFLDLLVSHVPLNCAVLLQKVTRSDLQTLVSAAASVVLRRDMSLNRRLWSWFLGPEPPTDQNIASPTSPIQTATTATGKKETTNRIKYFQNFGLGPLVESLQIMLDDRVTLPSEKAKPFRICLSLMDRNEVGDLLLPVVFKPLMHSLQRFEAGADSPEDFEEVLRSANAFFDGVESRVIWTQINGTLDWDSDMDGTPHEISERLDFIIFLVRTFNVHEAEMLHVHIPLTMLRVLVQLRKILLVTPKSAKLSAEMPVKKFLGLLIDLVEILPEKAPAEEINADSVFEPFDTMKENKYCLERIKNFYAERSDRHQNGQNPIAPAFWGKLMLENLTEITLLALTEDSQQRHLDLQILLLEKVVTKFSLKNMTVPQGVQTTLIEASTTMAARQDPFGMSFKDVHGILRFFEIIGLKSSKGLGLPGSHLYTITHNLLRMIWPGLSPINAHCNVEAARCLWRVQYLTAEQCFVQSSLTHLMLHQRHGCQTGLNIDEARRFTVLWMHSFRSIKSQPVHTQKKSSAHVRRKSRRNPAGEELKVLSQPLYLMLDALQSPQSDLGIFVSGWLSSLTNAEV